jgi:hypothetical protein
MTGTSDVLEFPIRKADTDDLMACTSLTAIASGITVARRLRRQPRLHAAAGEN